MRNIYEGDYQGSGNGGVIVPLYTFQRSGGVVIAVPLDLFQGMGREGRLQCHWTHFIAVGERGVCRHDSGEWERRVVPVPLEALQSSEREGWLQCHWTHEGVNFSIWIHAFWWRFWHSSLGTQKMFQIKVSIMQIWTIKSTFSFQSSFLKYWSLFVGR